MTAFQTSLVVIKNALSTFKELNKLLKDLAYFIKSIPNCNWNSITAQNVRHRAVQQQSVTDSIYSYSFLEISRKIIEQFSCYRTKLYINCSMYDQSLSAIQKCMIRLSLQSLKLCCVDMHTIQKKTDYSSNEKKITKRCQHGLPLLLMPSSIISSSMRKKLCKSSKQAAVLFTIFIRSSSCRPPRAL